MNKDVENFILYLKTERKYAINTQKAYKRDLQKLTDFCANEGLNDWSKLSYGDLNLFVMNIRNNGANSRTIRRYLSSVRSFLNFLLKKNIIDNNCAVGLQSPKIPQSLPKTLSYNNIEQMLNVKSNSKNQLRDVAIIEVLYSCGLRVSELVGLDINDIDENFLLVLGKGGKMRNTPIGEKATIAIKKYLKKNKHTEGALFVDKSGNRIGVRSVQNIVKKRALDAGVKINVHPHMLRHAAATHFLQSSHDLRTTQEFLGHKSIKSTQVYTHLDYLELAKVYDKFHPHAKK